MKMAQRSVFFTPNKNAAALRALTLGIWCGLLSIIGQAQPTFNANNRGIPYTGPFRAGYNPGYFQGWTDITLANIAAGNPSLNVAGVGTKSVRQGLYFELLNVWGTGVRLPEVQHFEGLGMGELTALILGGSNGGTDPAPPNDVRDLANYCPGLPSMLFDNLYEPIWDNGANGTPYNEENYYAAYLYETVNTYKDYVRFWEIWNEPGFDLTGDTGWRPQGDPAGNWWDANPDPCDYKLRAPIQHYVRMLRISWEIIKTLDPESYVCMSSPGYQSFLDAVLRNTDNPSNGIISNEYPLQGGAYFDCLAYHSYPHFDGSTFVELAPSAVFMRNSDRCADGVVDKRNYFQIILDKHGYNNVLYPKKEFIVTEINLPRKSFGFPAFFGSDVAQRNFVMKAFVNAKKEKIHQLHFYSLAETKTEAEASYEFDMMGLYKNLTDVPLSSIQLNEEGIALKTTSDLLSDTEYDPIMTNSLPIPNNIRVEAFKKPDGKYVFVLWAKTNTDLSELASASFSFPLNVTSGGLKYQWDWSQTGETSPVGPFNLTLTGSPIFIVGEATVAAKSPSIDPKFTISPNPTNIGSSVSFDLPYRMNTSIALTDQLGRTLRVLYEGESHEGLNTFPINGDEVGKGVYFVVLKTEQGVFTRKLVKN